MLHAIKHFITTNDYLDFKLGAIFLAILSLPASDPLGVTIKVIGILTGCALLLKACYGVYNEHLNSRNLKNEKEISNLKIKNLIKKKKYVETES